MRYIDTSFAIDPTTQQPFTTKSLDFLQIGTIELVNAICNNLIYSNGLTPTSGVPYLIDSAIAGGSKAIFFNSKIYITVATLTGYAHIDTTPDAVADPLLFTDLVNRNVHNDNYLIFNATAAGAIFNFSQVIDISNKVNTAITMLNGWSTYQVAPSYKISNREVVLSGNANTGPGGPTASTLCVVPAPSVLRRIVCGTNVNGVFAATLILIDTSGNLVVANATAGVFNQINFDGISYAL